MGEQYHNYVIKSRTDQCLMTCIYAALNPSGH